MPVGEPGLGFPTFYVVDFFMFNMLRLDAIVHFVDTDGLLTTV